MSPQNSNVDEDSELNKYKKQVSEKIEALIDVFANLATGDFLNIPDIPEDEDEFTALFLGLRFMIDELQLMRKRDILSTQALIESDERYKALFDRSLDGIYIHDFDGKILDANTGILHMLGFNKSDITSQNFLSFLSNSQSKLVYESLAELLETGTQKDVLELQLKTKAGDSVWLETKSSIIYKNSEPYAIQSVARDVTERKLANEKVKMLNEELEERVKERTLELKTAYEDLKRLQEQVNQSQRMESIGIVTGGIAHDFNNILTAIMGNISLAKLSVDSQEKTLRLIDESERACLRAKDLIQQLLTFSKGKTPVKNITSISDLVKESASFMIRGSNVRCEYSIPDDLYSVDADSGQINQVINNLIINAEQAMPNGGIINIQMENVNVGSDSEYNTPSLNSGKYIKLSISDQGVGILPEHLNKIFEPYFTTKKKGSGLGLATAYSIVNKHDGQMIVESEVGIGTTISVYLPATDKNVPRNEEICKRPTEEFHKEKILIMDDEQIIRDLVGEILTRSGYETVFATDGAEAIEIYEEAKKSKKPVDAVIMDLTIPNGMGGKEAIEKLLEIDPGIKAIVSSGYSNDPIMTSYEQFGFSGVIAKPYKIQELSKTICEILEKK